MKNELLLATLTLTSAVAGFTVFSKTARRLILGWLTVGLLQSVFMLMIGFELLSILNLFFVASTATVLHLFSAVFGTGALFTSESVRVRRDWIYGLGSGATLAGILIFALAGHAPLLPVTADVTGPIFARELISRFPELPWLLGIVLFLGIIAWSSIGRPGWKRVRESERR